MPVSTPRLRYGHVPGQVVRQGPSAGRPDRRSAPCRRLYGSICSAASKLVFASAVPSSFPPDQALVAMAEGVDDILRPRRPVDHRDAVGGSKRCPIQRVTSPTPSFRNIGLFEKNIGPVRRIRLCRRSAVRLPSARQRTWRSAEMVWMHRPVATPLTMIWQPRSLSSAVAELECKARQATRMYS